MYSLNLEIEAGNNKSLCCQPSPIWWWKEKKTGMPRAPALPHASPPRLRPSVSSVHPPSSFSPSAFHPHLSAQKVSKCQTGVVIIFNGIIFLHRNTVDLPAYVCACVCVQGCWRENNQTGWNRAGCWKLEIAAFNKGQTQASGEREGKSLRLR